MASGLFVDEWNVLENRFSTQWGGRTPIEWPNTPFLQPVGSPWVRITIQRATGGRQSLGPVPLRRFPGTIAVSIFIPEDKGRNVAANYADLIGAMFRDQTFTTGSTGRIICQDVNIQDQGVAEGWYQLVVLVTFYRDDYF